jgi:PAS domain S-box-containing protein
MQTDITRYKQTEEDLYLTQLVVENSPAIIFRWRYAPEEGWPVEFVSHNVDQFGYTPDDFLVTNLPYTSIMHPDDNDRIKHEIETYQADGIDRFQLEYRIMTKAGQVRWVDERTVIERDATGRITHTQGLIIDVTDHKQAALALHESETLFRATFEEAPLGIGLTDTEGGVMTSNLVLQAMLGYSGAELQHLTIADFIHANDIDQYVSFHRDLANGTRHICQFEHRYLRKDGQVIWSRITASPVRDQDGRTLFHMTMVEDITQLKQTEQALHQSEARYLALVTNLGEGIISAGPDDEIIFANPVAEEIFGVPSGGLISKKLKEFTRPEQFDTIRSKMEQLRTGQKCSFSLEVIRPNGQHRQLLVTATPNVNDELQFSGMFGVIRDITERIRTEETLGDGFSGCEIDEIFAD